MTNVKLYLPPEILAEADVPYEGVRDLDGIVLAIDGINVAASVITLATLRFRARSLVAAIRRWRLSAGHERPITLTVKGANIDLKIDLPPNVSSGELLDQLRPLLGDGPDER
jgi:hypothetical protein